MNKINYRLFSNSRLNIGPLLFEVLHLPLSQTPLIQTIKLLKHHLSTRPFPNKSDFKRSLRTILIPNSITKCHCWRRTSLSKIEEPMKWTNEKPLTEQSNPRITFHRSTCKSTKIKFGFRMPLGDYGEDGEESTRAGYRMMLVPPCPVCSLRCPIPFIWNLPINVFKLQWYKLRRRRAAEFLRSVILVENFN